MSRPAYAQSTVARLTITATLVALSVVGSYLKIPSPTGTVALDSLPGFLGAILLGYPEGAVIGFLGHILTSLNVGFPLGLPVHLLIACEMAVICVLFRLLYQKNRILGIACGVFLNGVLAPATLVPVFGWGFFTGIVVSLLVASAVNIILASLIFEMLKKR
jgi:uncharacterized membrane protein